MSSRCLACDCGVIRTERETVVQCTRCGWRMRRMPDGSLADLIAGWKSAGKGKPRSPNRKARR